MKRLYSRKAKILLAIACTLFFVCFGMCVKVFLLIDSDNNQKEIQDRIYDNAGNAYAAMALSKYESGFNVDFLNQMNCYYGIMEGYASSYTDMNDPSIYTCRNFDSIPVPDNRGYFLKTYTINDTTVFKKIGNYSALLSSEEDFIYTDDYKFESMILDVEGIGYDTRGKKVYVYAGGCFYPLDQTCVVATDLNTYTDEKIVDSIYELIWDTNKTDVEETTEENDKLYIAGNGYDPISKLNESYKLYFYSGSQTGILSCKYVADLTPIHDTLENRKSFNRTDTRFTDTEHASKIRTDVENPENKNYTFICFPNKAKLSSKDHANDYYAKAQKLVDLAQMARLFLPIIGMIALLLQLICFALFMRVAGHSDHSEEIVDGPIEKMPIDLTLLLTVIVEIVILNLGLGFELDVRPLYFDLIRMAIGFILVSVVWLIFCSSLAVNFKLHRLHKNCLFIKAFMKIEWKTRIWIIYGIATLVLFWIMNSFADIFYDYPEYFILFFIDKAILALAIFLWIRSYSKIKGTVEKLAEGDTTARVDVTGMPQFMRDTGEAINDIQEGIEIALVERTKSERLKTELLTNVSHDIKTPITSIINYVDLLDKEKLKNDNAKEYIEVLNRQSLRLKKLVEDLIEASKVTTGNIEFDMEQVNAGVLLDQSIGEFAERLEKNNIEVVVNNEDGEMMLRADNRYLWRVFDNIMSNIVKYAQANTRAYVDLKKDGDKLRFIFRNTSRDQLNISPEELMERFVRGDKSRYTDGNGLGLSIARSLTEAMGGTMNIFIDGDFFKVILEFDAIVESGE